METAQQSITINSFEFKQMLEPLIRRVIREELKKLIHNNPNIFYVDREMPLYKDMEEISIRNLENKIELFAHDEVWND